LDKVIRLWAPTTKANFLTGSFTENWVTVQIFRWFDWLSNVSGSKVMAKKEQKCWENPQKSLWG